MPHHHQDHFRSNVINSLLFVSRGVLGAFIVTLLVLVATSWRTNSLVKPIQEHYLALKKTKKIVLAIHRLHDPEADAIHTESIPQILAQIDNIVVQSHNLNADSLKRFENARQFLDRAATTKKHAETLSAMSEMLVVLENETITQAKLISDLYQYSLSELWITAGALIIFPLLAIVIFILFRRQILASLDRVADLLDQLARREFVPTPVTEDAAELKPVLESFNVLVDRLSVAEAENARRREELEDQVRSATHTLLQQSRELADADRLAAVGETSGRIAHELRNPLAGIELALRNIKADYEHGAGHPEEPLSERLDPLVSELQRMSRLVTELVEGGRRSPEPAVELDLADCIDETISLVRYQAPDKIEIEQVAPKNLRCTLPKDSLRQVIFNLLLNAVEAIGPRPGKIVIETSNEDNTNKIIVEDDGPGFPDDILKTGPRLFVTRRAGGSGIGLATVRRITEMMGGTLTLSNRPSGGARVSLSFPCGGSHA